MQGFVAAGLVALLTSGCALDRHREYRPTRLQLGASTRRFASPPAALAIPRTSGQPVDSSPQVGATGSAQFTMTLRRHLFLGGELEAGGFLDRDRTNLAGAYAIAGLETSSQLGSLGIEVASGYRTMRFGGGIPEVDTFAIEPRVRGQLWLSDQISFGVAAGSTFGEHRAWMTGFYLGVHSQPFDSWRR